MDEDDEFGDLYTDVLRPFETSAVQSQPVGGGGGAGPASIDLNVNSDDEDILYGASNTEKSFPNSKLNSAIGLKLNQEKTLADMGGGFDLNLDSNLGGSRILGGSGSSFGGKGSEKGEVAVLPEMGPGRVDFLEEDDLNIVVEEGDNKDDDLVEKGIDLKDKKEYVYSSGAEGNEGMSNFLGQSAAGEPMIPGLSGRVENRGGSNFEDEWDSDESDDDLQIVLNDNHGPTGMERMQGVGDDEDDDADGEPLVIVADNGDASHHPHHPQMMMDEQEWGGEEVGSGADGEKKELGDAAKASGGSTAGLSAVQPKIGYSNHMYHHPSHSQFKYVRPGVAPLPGAPPPVAPGGIQGQARPPTVMGPVGGRGRGDWKPAGLKGAVPMQKGYPGYGMPTWGANAAGRGYGSGLDFTLPSHKTIFEVDIDGFEEKPWKLPGIDLSDFFNFGLNEESWKDYCKQLEQLRLETTMQSKIRVYESGRAEQDYDPDLPPELAAAVGGQDLSSAKPNPGKMDAGPTDLARSNARGRPPVLIGRPIPVETGSGDRLPSIDTRRPRMHDSDAIIEIVCQGSTDDPDLAEPDNEPAGEDLADEIDDTQQHDVEQIDDFSRTYDGPKREPVARKAFIKNAVSSNETGREENLHFDSERTDREVDVPHEDRSAKKRGPPKSPNMIDSYSNGEKQTVDDQNGSFDSKDGKRNPPLSPSCAAGSDEEQAVALGDDGEESVKDDRASGMENDEMGVDATTSDALEDGKLTDSTNKGNISSHEEQTQENDDGEEAVRSSENSKARSESSKDHRKFHEPSEDEVLQETHPHAGNSKRPVGEEDNGHRKGQQGKDETERHNMAGRGREDSHSHRGGDPNSSLQNMRSDSADRRRESDISEGSWRRRDEDLHGRRIRVDDARKREHGGEIASKSRVKVRESERSEKDERRHVRNELDNSWRGANHDQDYASRQRDRDDNPRSREEMVGDLHQRRRKEAAPISRELVEKEDAAHNYRESSSHRKRERDNSSDRRKIDDISDRRKRVDSAKLKDDVHHIRQKRQGSAEKERGEKQRDRDEWNRPKQSHEQIYSRMDREETRPTTKSARTAEDKTQMSSRGKDDYRVSGREYHTKDVGRNSDQLKRRDHVENEKNSQHRGHEDVHARVNQVNDYEKRARSGRSGTNDDRPVHVSETSRLHELRQEGSRKIKESVSGEHNSLVHSKRSEDDHGGPISEKVSTRGRSERDSGKDDAHDSRHSSRRHREEPSSDDEQSGARKGRSKLERWTSHKETDFSTTTSVSLSSSKKNKDPHTHNNLGTPAGGSKLPEESSRKGEDKPPRPSADDKGTDADINNAAAKSVDDKHLDTVAKLKKRSERFKLPMPSEKDAISIKKMESEPLPSAQPENHPDSEIKSERPARKRRWTGN